jgi:hypothetical protein
MMNDMTSMMGGMHWGMGLIGILVLIARSRDSSAGEISVLQMMARPMVTDKHNNGGQ